MAEDGRQWAHDAAAMVRAVIERAIEDHGQTFMALSGGSTPRLLYRTLTNQEWKQRVTWKRVHFLFGDERCVPPDHPESNFALARTELFQPLGIAQPQISRMKGEVPDHAQAALDYEERLRSLTHVPPPGLPALDLVLLGLGDDGHTASLFPGTDALEEKRTLVAVGQAPAGIRDRLTLTLGVINRASVVLFLVTGARKATMVQRVIEPRCPEDRLLPAARVVPESGRLVWMLDRSAAAGLTTRTHGT